MGQTYNIIIMHYPDQIDHKSDIQIERILKVLIIGLILMGF